MIFLVPSSTCFIMGTHWLLFIGSFWKVSGPNVLKCPERRLTWLSIHYSPSFSLLTLNQMDELMSLPYAAVFWKKTGSWPKPWPKNTLQSMKVAVMPQVFCSQKGTYISFRHLEIRWLSSQLSAVGYLDWLCPWLPLLSTERETPEKSRIVLWKFFPFDYDKYDICV